MAKMDKLMKSFEAFINNDSKAATQMYREFFIESAQEINKQLEEGMDEELEEAFGGDMGDDFMDDVAVEDEGMDDMDDEFGGEEAADEFGMEDDMGEEAPAEEAPSSEEWAEIQDAFDELEALFDELGGGDEPEEDLGFEDDSMDDMAGDELEFGDEDELEESFQMKKVADPGMKKEEGDVNKATIVAKKAKSVSGIKGTDGWTKDGTVTGSNTELDTSSAETPKVEDQNNVMDNGKSAYKKTSEPNMKHEEAGVETQSLQKDLRK